MFPSFYLIIMMFAGMNGASNQGGVHTEHIVMYTEEACEAAAVKINQSTNVIGWYRWAICVASK